MNRRFPLVCIAFLSLSPAWCWAQTPAPSPRKSLSSEHWQEKLEQGDIVFIRSRTANAPLIAALSNVNANDDNDQIFTHCGIIFKEDGELKVYEGEGRGAGVHYTLEKWQREVSKGTVNGKELTDLHKVYVMRWNGQPALGTKLDAVLSKAKELHDTRYDHGFYWSDAAAYCSELVWKAYETGGLSLGDLPKMEKYVTAAPTPVAAEIKKKLDAAAKEYREGNGYLKNDPAISPEDIYKSQYLTPITD